MQVALGAGAVAAGMYALQSYWVPYMQHLYHKYLARSQAGPPQQDATAETARIIADVRASKPMSIALAQCSYSPFRSSLAAAVLAC